MQPVSRRSKKILDSDYYYSVKWSACHAVVQQFQQRLQRHLAVKL